MPRLYARLLSVGLALLLPVSLTACGGPDPVLPVQPTPSATAAPVQQKTEVFQLPCYPEAGFHPFTGANKTNLVLNGLLYEGLYELDPTFHPQSVLAVSHSKSEDGLSWTFTLRQGVTFSDGSPLTPADVAASLNLARQEGQYAARLAGITGVAAGEGSVTVTLSKPNGALPALLDVPIVKGTGERPVGTGPYVLTGEGETLALTARMGWWRGEQLPLDTIALWAVQEPDDFIYAFDTHDLSLVSADLTGADTLGYSGSYETVDFSTSVLLYLGFNTASGPCREEAVRRALARGLDRQTIAASLLSSHAQPSALPFHPESEYYDAAQDASLAYAPQAMLDQLQAAGWSWSGETLVRNGQPLSLTLIVNQDNIHRQGVADFLAESLTQVGISVTVQKLPWEGYLTALKEGQFDLYLGETRLTGDFDPAPLLIPGGGLNYGRFSSPAVTSLVEAYQGAEGAARTTAAKALSAALIQQVPIAPLCFKNWSVLSQWGQLSALSATQQNLFYHFWSWEFG